MEYKPRRNKKNALLLITVFALLSVACLIMVNLHIGPNLLGQLSLICFVTGALFVAVRYLLTDFVYRTDKGYLEVIKISSKIPVTLASVRISQGDCAVKQKADMSEYKVQRRASFNLTLRAGELYWYIFEINGQRQALILECDERYAEYLRSLIASSKGEGGAGL